MSLTRERGAEKQTEEQEAANFGLLDEIEQSTKSDPELTEAYEDIKRSIVNYKNLLEAREKKAESGERITAQEAEEAELSRKTTHDALIDKLNYLSRREAEKGIEPEWRNSWGPLESLVERQNITKWVKKVAPMLEQEQEEKRRKELEEIERRRGGA